MKKSKNLFAALFIIFIMVMSTLGFIYSGGGSEKYNGYKFQQTDQGWATFVSRTNSYQTFTYLPSEVEDMGPIDIKGNLIYVVDKSNGYQGARLRDVFTSAGIISQFGSLDDNSTLPIIDCDGDNFVVVLDSSADEDFYLEDNCIFINGNLNKGIDFLAYVVFGIIV
ncbi:MAG: hypothetical protein ABIH25_01840 [Candidatus Woesearchaeota archaeon]